MDEITGEFISRDEFVLRQRELYCKDCDRRKGMKNGKMRFCYEIGGVPCRACDVDDMIDSVEDFPAADVKPVVRGCIVTGKYGYRYCSVCHSDITLAMYLLDKVLVGNPNFCPNCGADIGKNANG